MGGRGSGGGKRSGGGGGGGGGGASQATQEKLNSAFGPLPEGYQNSAKATKVSFYESQVRSTERELAAAKSEVQFQTDHYYSGRFVGKMSESSAARAVTSARNRQEAAEKKLKAQRAALSSYKGR